MGEMPYQRTLELIVTGNRSQSVNQSTSTEFTLTYLFYNFRKNYMFVLNRIPTAPSKLAVFPVVRNDIVNYNTSFINTIHVLSKLQLEALLSNDESDT